VISDQPNSIVLRCILFRSNLW